MKFSTKAEYGLKAMANLAASFPIQKNLQAISREEKISSKYLEQMIGNLRKNNLVVSTKGKNGGYTLSKNPRQIRVGEIIEILDGAIAPMKCVGKFCAQRGTCTSSQVWDKVAEQVKRTLYKIKLSELI
ncbi:MAG TPA: Rrf2 family transcriptional regulator [Candidatus Moranbacteria bacterium]|nr:Rrf2 family transcriptional regulator [Candidatus Moranbacteria bacterium]